MEIDRIYYPVKTLGYGERIGIWTVGCPHRCRGCSNPELWESNITKDISVETIIRLIKSIDEKVDGITITGGEPFLQSKELSQLILELNQLGYDDILIYTGYTYDELNKSKDPYIPNIISNISTLIDGRYIDELNDNKPQRGSSNQNVMVLNEKYSDLYKKEEQARTVQNVFYEDGLISIGIPIKDFRSHINNDLIDYGIRE